MDGQTDGRGIALFCCAIDKRQASDVCVALSDRRGCLSGLEKRSPARPSHQRRLEKDIPPPPPDEAFPDSGKPSQEIATYHFGPPTSGMKNGSPPSPGDMDYS